MRTIKLFLITNLLLFFISSSTMAQQGTVSTGGDATGAGGTMSYSVGLTDFQYYSSGHGSLSLGLQQTWIMSTEPPQVLEISDLAIADGQALCFNATETVIVAGDGNLFTIHDGGYAEIIAGQNILLKYGTSVEHGGSLYAHISTVWCDPIPGMLASHEEETFPDYPAFEPTSKSAFFKVYPNPTTGEFTLELLAFEANETIVVGIYSIQGHLLQIAEYLPQKYYNFNLADKQPGMYILRVVRNLDAGMSKLILQ
jgi:hypothetical protein